MAKDKNKIILKDCIKCKESFERDGKLYCRLRLQDESILQQSGIVSKQDCIWFKESEK